MESFVKVETWYYLEMATAISDSVKERERLAARVAELEADLSVRTKQFNESIAQTKYWTDLAQRRLKLILRANGLRSKLKDILAALDGIDPYT